MKTSEDSSTKYYQNNKERLQKKFREKYKSISEEEKKNKKNSSNMGVKGITISLRCKTKPS